jgi:hypothetical protein
LNLSAPPLLKTAPRIILARVGSRYNSLVDNFHSPNPLQQNRSFSLSFWPGSRLGKRPFAHRGPIDLALISFVA